jgi:hypothetical protein
LDADGCRIDDEVTEVFASLPPPPKHWDEATKALNFKIPRGEREYLQGKLSALARPNDGAPSLLARLVEAGDVFQDTSLRLPEALDGRADEADRLALGVARDAAASMVRWWRNSALAMVSRTTARFATNSTRTSRSMARLRLVVILNWRRGFSLRSRCM